MSAHIQCNWCKEMKPIEEINMGAKEVDAATGMATEEEEVCNDCLPTQEESESELYGETERNFEDDAFRARYEDPDSFFAGPFHLDADYQESRENSL